MINSRYFGDIRSAKEFEMEVDQMFQYANHPDVIDAACYFKKGAELMQKYFIGIAVKEGKSNDNT